MNGVGKCRRRLTKATRTVAHNLWNRLNKDSLVVHSLNVGGGMLLISFGNSLPKIEPWHEESFSVMQCLFDQSLCKSLKWFNRI